MSYSAFSDNDDDLFSESNFSDTNSNRINTPNDEIKSLLESIDQKDLEKIDSMFFRSKVALTLFDGANSYVYDTFNSYNRSIFNTLNFLTNNQFQYNLYADVLEESITRRLIIKEFLEACVDNVDSEFLSKLSKVMNITIDEKFLATYFESFLDMLNFVIDDNISLYVKVCQQVNREPMSAILNKKPDEDINTIVSSNTYMNNVFHNIKHSLGHGYFK